MISKHNSYFQRNTNAYFRSLQNVTECSFVSQGTHAPLCAPGRGCVQLDRDRFQYQHRYSDHRAWIHREPREQHGASNS
jgi:hypothetical protein